MAPICRLGLLESEVEENLPTSASDIDQSRGAAVALTEAAGVVWAACTSDDAVVALDSEDLSELTRISLVKGERDLAPDLSAHEIERVAPVRAQAT